jgi:hypothetical protein
MASNDFSKITPEILEMNLQNPAFLQQLGLEYLPKFKQSYANNVEVQSEIKKLKNLYMRYLLKITIIEKQRDMLFNELKKLYALADKENDLDKDLSNKQKNKSNDKRNNISSEEENDSSEEEENDSSEEEENDSSEEEEIIAPKKDEYLTFVTAELQKIKKSKSHTWGYRLYEKDRRNMEKYEIKISGKR